MRLLRLGARRIYLPLNRYRKIAEILIKYGFGEVLAQTHLDKTIRVGRRLFTRHDRKKPPEVWERTTWERIRLAVQELGPTFIKLGQIMSNRPDLIPQELVVELGKLQDEVPPFPGSEAVAIVESELSRPIDDVFSEFDEKPIAAGSIAQVHRAVTADGQEVAIKVQRPGIRKIIDADIQILYNLAGLLEKYFEDMALLNPTGIVQEFEATIKRELDFLVEATNMERFARRFENEPTVHIPGVVREHTTATVLTMEFIRADKLTLMNSEEFRAAHDTGLIARRGAQLTVVQIFEHGFFHGDPHAGNLLILPEDVICYLDYGQMGLLSKLDRALVGDLLVGIANQDYRKTARAVIRITGDEQIESPLPLERAISELISRYYDASLKDFRLSDVLSQVLNVILMFQMRLPPNLYLLIKVLITIEGIAKSLDPDFKLLEFIEPAAVKIIKDRYNPRRLATAAASEIADILQDLPADYRQIIGAIRRAKMNFAVEARSLEPLQATMLKVTGFLVFSIILAAMIIGSALIVHSALPPLFAGIPIIGIAGFMASGVLGFWLLFSIIRNRML